MKESTRLVLAIIAYFMALLYAIYQGGELAWHLLGFLMVLGVLVGLSQIPSLRQVSVHRTLRPGPYRVGEDITVHLQVKSQRYWPWPYLIIIDHMPNDLRVENPTFTVYSTGRIPRTLAYQVPLTRRGPFVQRVISLTSGDWFGIFRRQRQYVHEDSFVVWPETLSLQGSRIFSRIWHGENLAQHPTREESSHLRGIREYVPGDRLSQIHWKTSAHTGDFKVKQFEPETKPELTLILDASMHFTESEWELAISVTASLIEYAYQIQQVVGLAAVDVPESGITPHGGYPSFSAMMDFLSCLPYEPSGPYKRGIESWTGSRLVVVSTVAHQDYWAKTADWVIPIGTHGVFRLDTLRDYVNAVRAEVENS